MKIVKINGGKAMFKREPHGWSWSIYKCFREGFPRRVAVDNGYMWVLKATADAQGWAPTLRSARQNAHMQLHVSC